ncbi:MAG TPA: ABC transporter ATP-binding protein [Ignavibacteria bacterium]
MQNELLLEAFDIRKSYQITKQNKLHVLKGINLKIFRGEIAAIVGKSGAGKSTLLHILGALDTPDSGKLIFNNQDIFTYHDKEMASFRNKEVGFVFQFHHLLPEFTVFENILIPAMISKNINKNRINELLREVDLSSRADHKPSEISGGEAQRAAIARALINSPNLILADEPTGNLDTQNAESIIDLIFNLRKKHNTTFLIVTHNVEFAQRCDRIIRINDGIIPE